MHHDNLKHWQHSHAFGQDRQRPGERRTLLVIAITATMMVVEITTGILFGSMALLADGLHMASHAAALAISAFAYVYARRHAHDPAFSFGTGKVNALGGFTSAVLLAVFALMMIWESVSRFIEPVTIAFDQAILVAFVGLLVNGASVLILGHSHEPAGEPNHEHHHEHDQNLRAAYFHVLADSLTSLLAIVALLIAKYAGLLWMDPLMGIVGAVLVSRWSWGLLRNTSAVLLDKQGPAPLQEAIKQPLIDRGDQVTDLHLWSIGPGLYGVIVTVVSDEPQPPEFYKQLLPDELGLVHITVETHRCPQQADAEPQAALQVA